MTAADDDLDDLGWFITRHVPDTSLPDGFPVPKLRKRDHDSYTHVGPGGWDGYMPPEDSAVPPEMEWTEAHKILVLAAHEKKWGRFLEDNQTFEIVWPPTAYLTTDGYVTSGERCFEHEVEDCEDCDEFQETTAEIEPAEWSWSVKIETYERDGIYASLEDSDSFHFLTTMMDPRKVDYES